MHVISCMQATKHEFPVVLFICCEMRTRKLAERTERDSIMYLPLFHLSKPGAKQFLDFRAPSPVSSLFLCQICLILQK